MDSLSDDIRAQLLKDDAYFIGRPFSLAEGNARAIHANARHLGRLLRDTNVSDRASRAAAFAAQLLDITLRTHVTEPLACAKGCEHCCKTYVSVTIPEILNLARAVRGKAVKTARVDAVAARSRSMAQLDREIARLDCPMLEDRACSEYAFRPLVCRAVVSKSLESCLRIFYHRSTEPFAAADNSAAIRVYCMMILRTGLLLADLPHRHYEMNHALAIALADEDAEAKWLAGEPVFAGVAIDLADAAPSSMSAVVDGMVKALRPTL